MLKKNGISDSSLVLEAAFTLYFSPTACVNDVSSIAIIDDLTVQLASYLARSTTCKWRTLSWPAASAM